MAKDVAETLPEWQRLKYPNELRYIEVMVAYPDLEGRDYFELPAWLRLGWPSQALWERCARTEEREWARERKIREPNPWPVARMAWADVLKTYPHREGVAELEQDFMRVLRHWPDCFGQPIVEVELVLREGITINTLTYGPGKHRVPAAVAGDLRFIDNKARQDFIDQHIPKKHQDKVLVISVSGVGSQGEIRD